MHCLVSAPHQPPTRHIPSLPSLTLASTCRNQGELLQAYLLPDLWPDPAGDRTIPSAEPQQLTAYNLFFLPGPFGSPITDLSPDTARLSEILSKQNCPSHPTKSPDGRSFCSTHGIPRALRRALRFPLLKRMMSQ